MVTKVLGRLVAGVRQQPLRLLPLFLGLFMFLFFTGFLALTGRFGRHIEEELPEQLPEEITFVEVG